jgi:predicted TIM-barrel fold metal-dependent hydrolase
LYGDEVHRCIETGLAECSDEVRRKILWENARKLYRVEVPAA